MKPVRILAALSATAVTACSSYGNGGTGAQPPPSSNVLQATIGADGGVLTGGAGHPFEGVKLIITADASANPTIIQIAPVVSGTQLPATSVAVGAQFYISPAGLQL